MRQRRIWLGGLLIAWLVCLRGGTVAQMPTTLPDLNAWLAVSVVPKAPDMPSPAVGGVAGLPVTLTWRALGALSFDVRVCQGAGCTPVLVQTTASASYLLPGAVAGTAYRWQIIARNTKGLTYGQVWGFTTAATVTKAAGQPFTLQATHNGVNTTGYRLIVDGTTRVVVRRVDAQVGDTVNVSLLSGLPAGTYTIGLDAYNDQCSDGSVCPDVVAHSDRPIMLTVGP